MKTLLPTLMLRPQSVEKGGMIMKRSPTGLPISSLNAALSSSRSSKPISLSRALSRTARLRFSNICRPSAERAGLASVMAEHPGESGG